MGAMTLYLRNSLLNHIRGSAYPVPAALYLGLFSTPTDASGGGTEVAGGSYARQLITTNPATNGLISNSLDLLFPSATTNWGLLGYYGVFDAAALGNMLFYGVFDQAQYVNIGNVFRIQPDGLLITSNNVF